MSQNKLKERIELVDFKLSLNRQQAFELCKETLGLKVYGFKEPYLSDHLNEFVIDTRLLEKYLRRKYPEAFNKKQYSLKSIVKELYGDKIMVSIERLL